MDSKQQTPSTQKQHDNQHHPDGEIHSEAFLQMMIDSAKDYAIFAMDHNRNVTHWNTGARYIFGYTDEEIMGQPVDIIFVPEDRAAGVPQAEVALARENGFAQDDRWHMRKDGSRFFASGMMRPMIDEQGKLRGFMKVVRDITERVRVEAAEREQRALAEALRDTAAAINASLNLSEVLVLILEQVRRVVEYDAGYILLFDEQHQILQIHSKGYHEHALGDIAQALAQFENPLQDLPQLQRILTTKKPFIAADTQTCQPAQWKDPFQSGQIRSFAGVPIISQDQVLGFLNLHSLTPNAFSKVHTGRLTIFANQAALAIRNAQLHEMAQQSAAQMERRRLSRDLHDSVTQMLFASSVLAATLKLQVNNPEKVLKAAADLERLNRGALAEMRNLLRELRHSDITSVSLNELITQLAQIAMGNTPLTVTVEVDEHLTTPPNVHEVFYRITQEALNNVVKHSHATAAAVKLTDNPESVTLFIQDNGRGFDPKAVGMSSMGLGIMRERTAAIGASLDLSSAPGGGTKITVTWQKPHHQP